MWKARLSLVSRQYAGSLLRSALLPCALLCASAGCTPQFYRVQADHETYGILAQKTEHPEWSTPELSIDPPPESRNYDPYDPDCPPLPPDDFEAHAYMLHAGGHPGRTHWDRHGHAPSVEAPDWLEFLDLSDSGQLQLDADRAVELGLLNSRDYQLELENLYLAALNLSLERFEFQLQWFGGNRTFYEFLGNQISGRASGHESNTLSTSSNLGFGKSLTSGGQLLVDFANTFVWEFTGNDTSSSSSTISVGLVQPLLRRAFRNVRIEALTQSERDVLYAARDFARYRKQFYFDITSGQSGYLSLLLQLQAIRNLEANVDSLQQNLRTHEALALAGIVSPIQVDQVFQNYQTGQLRLIRARNNLQNALDEYKIQLGIPPEMEVELDDAPLDPFELNSPEITELQRRVEDLLASYRELDQAPGQEMLAEGFEKLLALHAEVFTQRELVAGELQQWVALDADAGAAGMEQGQREVQARRTLRMRLDEMQRDLPETQTSIEETAAALAAADPQQAWEDIQRLSRRVSVHIADLFVLQSQIRAYLIELEPVDFQLAEATEYGLAHRLDLMNRQAEVVDAWRRVQVAADALKSDLDVVADAAVGTRPGGNPVKFSSDASRFRVGIRFDAPLNRKLERNTYRSELIQYQRARRQFISSQDGVVQAVRLDLRELEADRLNFEIARQSLIAAARQVELARIQLLAPGQEGDSSTTQDALSALNSLLDAKNTLIGVWVSYETNRLQLLLDTESLQLDERGIFYDDDHSRQLDTPEPRRAPTPPKPDGF